MPAASSIVACISVADGRDARRPAAPCPAVRSSRRTSSAAWARDRRPAAGPALAAYSAAARPGAGAEHQALGQRVRAEPVGAVDADAGGLAGGVQAGERVSRRRCRCGRRPSCSARPGGPGSARSPGRSARTSGTARARTAAWCRSASRRGGAGRGGRPARTASPMRAALLHLVHERLGEPVARAELHAAQRRRPAWACPRS